MRDEVLGAGCNSNILEIIKELDRYEIAVEASFVAIPGITGWAELERSIYRVSEFENIKLARVMLAGYSKFASEKIKAKFKVDRFKLQEQVESLNSEVLLPVVFEPAIINDLAAEVIGVIKNTPAWEAGFKKGDIIIEVSGETVFSRVDAFSKFKENLAAKNKFNVLIARKRNNKELKVYAAGWKEYDYTGLVLANDFSPEEFNSIKSKLDSYQPERVLILTSELARDRLELIAEMLEKKFKVRIDVMAVPSNYFGGNIGAAGLLVVDDYKLIKARIDQNNYDLIITGSALFDIDGRDLKGNLRSELLDLFESDLVII